LKIVLPAEFFPIDAVPQPLKPVKKELASAQKETDSKETQRKGDPPGS
jgi:hypothetical protein